MIVETNQFMNAHGRLPRGRGSWAFQFYLPERGGWTDFVFIDGVYTDTRREAITRAKKVGATRIRVGS